MQNGMQKLARFKTVQMVVVFSVLILGVLLAVNVTYTTLKSVPSLQERNRVANFVPKCKYSVRDVAFVNVHGKAWQLQLVKPDVVAEEQFQTWNTILQTKLALSNVGYVWLEPLSVEANSVASHFDGKSDLPQVVLRNESDLVLPIKPKATFEATIDHLLDSDSRFEILNQVVDSLCVFVLVESSDQAKNEAARRIVNSAAGKVKRQMWTLEKPTDEGPAVVVIEHEQANLESLALDTLGFSDIDEPRLAIVYGQARRLGEILNGGDLTVEKIVGRASVCGSDCECDLNRDWLYGQQMVHVWTKDLERAAESTLNFDPNSAFVMAEVSQIINKNSGDNASSNRVDLGGGLVIHDLDSEPGNSVGQIPTPPANTGEVQNTPASTSEVEQVAPVVVLPWRLLLILGGIAIAAFVFFMARLT